MSNLIRQIVVTGAPGSGKRRLLLELERDPWFVANAIIEADVVGGVITRMGMKPEDFGTSQDVRWAFQRTVATTFHLKRALALDRARRLGRSVVVYNRFIPCGEVYMPNGLSELRQVTGMASREMIHGIDAVIWTAPPPEQRYVINEYRFEPYDLACQLGQKVREAYVRHKLPIHDIADREHFDDRRAAFMQVIRDLAGAEC